jgi:hypothetical protein
MVDHCPNTIDETSFIKKMQKTLNQCLYNYFCETDCALAKGLHGFPIITGNCYNWYVYDSIIYKQKGKTNNMLNCLCKIVQISAMYMADKQNSLMNLACPGGLFFLFWIWRLSK